MPGEGIRQYGPHGKALRAAEAFSGLPQPKFLKAIGMSQSQFNRTVRGKRDLELEEAKRISEVTDCPIWFLMEGFDGIDAETSSEIVHGLLTTIRELRAKTGRDVGHRDLQWLLLAASSARDPEPEPDQGSRGHD